MKTLKITLFALLISSVGFAQMDTCDFYSFQSSAPCGGSTEYNFGFDANSYNGSFYIWNYGDGTPDTTLYDFYSDHTFINPGTYTVTLKIIYIGGDTCSVSKEITTKEKCDFDIFQYVGKKYTFINNIVYNDSILWEIGDSIFTTCPECNTNYYGSIDYCFPDYGTYPVSITVYQPGAVAPWDSCCQFNTNLNVEPEDCDAFFTYEKTEDDSILIQIPSMMCEKSNGDFFNNYRLTFYSLNDTNSFVFDTILPWNDFCFKYKYLPTSQPPYHITLIKHKIGGEYYCTPYETICIDTITRFRENYCKAEFKYKEIDNPDSLPMFWFNADYNEGNQNIYQWEFDDGTPVIEGIDPVHVFPGDGSYNVCLTVYNMPATHPDTICSDVICKVVNVSNSDVKCVADFEAVQSESSKYIYHFTANTTVGNQDKYTWDFKLGDGFSYYPIDTIIDYGSVDTVYNICLAVENTSDGCQDTICKTIMLGDPLPIDSLENTVDTCIISLVVDSFYIYDVVEDSINTDSSYVIWAIVLENGDIIQIPSEYYFPVPGVYYVELIIHCGKDQSTSVGGKVLIRDNPGIVNSINNHNNKEADVYIYPNPVNDKLNISVNTENSTKADIQILNSVGQIISSKKYTFSNGMNMITFNINDLGCGLYFVRINTNNEIIVRKFVK